MRTSIITVVILGLVSVGCSGGKPAQAPINQPPPMNPPPVVNQPPTLKAVTDQTISANQTSTEIILSITDEELASTTLLVISDNTQLVPNTGFQVGGTGASRTLTITPASDLVGQATITAEVSDSAGLTASRQFLVSVNAESRSLDNFIREKISATDDTDPDLINAVEFVQDIDEQDFSELFNP